MLTLKAELRNEKGRDTQELREAGLIPAVLYGPGLKIKIFRSIARNFTSFTARPVKVR